MDEWMAASGMEDRWAAGWNAVDAAGRRKSTQARYSQVFGSFVRHAEANGVNAPEEVTRALCWGFVVAPVRGGRLPSTATSRVRLTVARAVFAAMASAGAVSIDPTTELRVTHPVAKRVPIPLTPPEARRLILTGYVSPGDTLRPVTIALALAGAAHAEIAGAVVSSFRPVEATLTLGEGHGARLVTVPPQLVDIFLRRSRHQQASWRRQGQPWDPQLVPLALNRPARSYPVNSVAPTVSNNLSRALRIAGIHRAGVQPKSIREYAANAVYATTLRIEAVSEQLGIPSYDSAARLIDRVWQEQWGDTVRAGGGDDG